MLFLNTPTYENYKDTLLAKYIHLRELLANKGEVKLAKLDEAFELAAISHNDMKRKSGEPYLFHPLEVAIIAVEIVGLGSTSAICALLHDTVEDTELTLEEIEVQFGTKVKDIVDGLTKISMVFDTVNKYTSLQAENFKKMLFTLGKDLRVILIKLCDRLHNMRTIDSVSPKTKLKIASETLFIYAPLANRLGLNILKTELEDLAFKVTQPKLHDEIKEKLAIEFASNEDYLQRFLNPLKLELENAGLHISAIQSRTKSIFSIANKMSKQQIPFEQVFDLFAVRIILDSPMHLEKSDCWRVYAIISDKYITHPSRLRDWLSKPRNNGYQALHTTIVGPENKYIEVQIRTKYMDEIAERGVAAHWKYKQSRGEGSDKTTEQDKVFDNWITQVKETLNNKSLNSIDLVNEFRYNILAEEIFIFTPTGEVKGMPKGSVALDFAFAVHTELGYKTIGAKVNGKLVPIDTQLRNSDIVEILTTSKNRVNADWLNLVKTGRAKTKIKDFLSSEKNKFASDGKEILQRKFKSAKIEFTNINVERFIKFMGFSVPSDFFHALGVGRLKSEKLGVAKFFLENIETKTKKIVPKKPVKPVIPISKAKIKAAVIVGEDYDVDYSLATCCNPLPGDPIFGFLTINEGIKIHRSDCKNATNLMSQYGYRIVPSSWRDEKYQQSFLSELHVNGIDDVGIVSTITDIISKDMGVNMKSINIHAATDGTFKGKLEVLVKDLYTLEQLITSISRAHEYIQISRIDKGFA